MSDSGSRRAVTVPGEAMAAQDFGHLDSVRRAAGRRVDPLGEVQKISEALRVEGQAWRQDDRDIRERLERAQAGGLHVGFIGLLWLVVGVLLTTFYPEIVRFRS